MEDLIRQLMQGSQSQAAPDTTDGGSDALSQMLQSMLGGQMQSTPEAAGGSADPLAQLLQGMAGSQPQANSNAMGGGDPLAQLLQGMAGSQPQASPSAAASGDDSLTQLLQGMMGGGAAQDYGVQAETGVAESGSGLGGLLQGILGGSGGLAGGMGPASTSSAGGFGDILGAIMGGGSTSMESDSFLAPIVSALANKIGLPPQVAQAVVAFVVGKLLGNRLQSGMTEFPTSGSTARQSRAARPQSVSLEDVVQRMNSGQRVRKTEIRGTGLARELSAYTGLDRATSEASLQQVLNMLGGQLGTGR